MFKEIYFFATLGIKSRYNLRECVSILERRTNNQDFSKRVMDLLSKKETTNALLFLLEAGASELIPYQDHAKFWDNLQFVASGHKMRSQIVEINTIKQGLCS